MTKRYRIVFIISSLGAGGAERVLSVIANAMAQKGHCITVAMLAGEDHTPHYHLDSRLELLKLGLLKTSNGLTSALRNNWVRLFRIRSEIQRLSPDFVIPFMDQVNVLVLAALLGLRVPVFACEHSDPAQHNPGLVWNLLRRMLYPTASRVVVLTDQARQAFGRAIRSKCIVIPNPVLPAAESKDKGFGFISVGRLSPEKGQGDLLKAYSCIHEDVGGRTLTIVGGGELRNKLQQLSLKLGIDEKVVFTGTVEDVSSYLNQADIFVFPSHYEGFGMALAEAMAHKLAVISTDCPSGPREMIVHGENGIMVPVADHLALASAMHSLASDESLRMRLSVKAPGVTRRFALSKIVAKWESALEDVCA